MPSYHIWIRKEDEAKWKAIENKPEWLHEHLDMPKATKDGYRSEHFYGIGTKVTDLYPELNQTPKTGVLTSAYLEEQFDKAGGKEVITEIVVTPPEDVA